MKVLVAFLALAVVGVQSEDPIVCNVGTSTVFAVTNCTVGATMCSMPKFIEYTGYSDVALACGPCAAGTKDSTCLECTAGKDNTTCNVLEKAGKDFDCYAYSYTAPAKDAPKTDLGTYKLGKAVACHRLATTLDTAIKCQKPGKNATKDTFANGYCGPCAGGSTNATCISCTGAKCNSAAALTFVLLPLVALFYNLF